uniref:Uncharacterized protein n=1 Tax=Panagrolaimus sp. PS1159 TaxID=55785 RepID=A0AC35F4E2_9BILA
MLRLVFLLFFVTLAETRFEDIINPRNSRQFLDLKTYNLTLRHWQSSLAEFQTKEIFEYFASGFSLSMPNVTIECVEDIAMIGLVLLNQSNAFPEFDETVSQSK